MIETMNPPVNKRRSMAMARVTDRRHPGEALAMVRQAGLDADVCEFVPATLRAEAAGTLAVPMLAPRARQVPGPGARPNEDAAQGALETHAQLQQRDAKTADAPAADAAASRFSNGASRRDALGALPSASMFRRRLNGVLADAITRRMPLAVLVLELGETPECLSASSPRAHAMLAAFATRLARLLRGSPLLHHGGPTSFTCVLTEIPLAAELHGRVAALVAALAPPFEVDGRECTARMRIGVATCPSDGLTGEVLRKRAAAAAASLPARATGALADVAYFGAQGD